MRPGDLQGIFQSCGPSVLYPTVLRWESHSLGNEVYRVLPLFFLWFLFPVGLPESAPNSEEGGEFRNEADLTWNFSSAIYELTGFARIVLNPQLSISPSVDGTVQSHL